MVCYMNYYMAAGFTRAAALDPEDRSSSGYFEVIVNIASAQTFGAG